MAALALETGTHYQGEMLRSGLTWARFGETVLRKLAREDGMRQLCHMDLEASGLRYLTETGPRQHKTGGSSCSTLHENAADCIVMNPARFHYQYKTTPQSVPNHSLLDTHLGLLFSTNALNPSLIFLPPSILIYHSLSNLSVPSWTPNPSQPNLTPSRLTSTLSGLLPAIS